MKLNVKDFGIIESASININGLTVICGENDTGKSTIGKLLFAIVKASQKYEDDLGENIIDKVSSNLSKIMGLISPFRADEHVLNIYEYFRRINRNMVIHRELLTNDDINMFHQIVNESSIDIEIKMDVFSYLDDISKIINERLDETELKRNALNKALFSEFKKIRNNCSVTLYDDIGQIIMNFNIENSKIQNLNFEEKMNIEDITYIESPFIIQFRKMFMNAMTLIDEKSTRSWIRETVSLHLKDLARKLNNYDPQRRNLIRDDNIKYISNEISEIINGDFYFDEKQDDFILDRNGTKFPSMTIASGIKSLGLLNSLIKGNIINKNSLLILDEPETNLHPKWQNDYAKILCNLVDNNIKIITVTHSPYMISALEHYSKEIKNKNFYWANKKENGFVFFEDRTDSIMRNIVQKFANAFDELN